MKKRGLLIGVLLFACVAGMTASETAVAASRVRLCAERKDGTGMDTTYYQSFESARVQANKARRAEIQLLADAGFNGAAKIQSITTNLTIDPDGSKRTNHTAKQSTIHTTSRRKMLYAVGTTD